MKTYDEGEQLLMFALDFSVGKMFPEPSHREHPKAKTSASSSRRSSELKTIPYLFLDLTPGHGNLLGESYWEMISPYAGGSSTLNTGPAPLREENVYTLSQILQEDPPTKYYLSRQACLGILRRSAERGKELPEKLKRALDIQSGSVQSDGQMVDLTGPDTNQQNEEFDGYNGDLTGNVSATLGVNCGMSTGRNGVLCLNDQGGRVMECSVNVTGTLRAQEHGHQPLVYENHGIDSRYTGPHSVAPTMSARYGTGGNNVPLVEQKPVYCIVGNAIDRQPQNGGNGKGYQENISYTLTAMDRHAVWNEPYQEVVGALCRGDEKGIGNQYISQDKCIVSTTQLIRRLTSLECERLQGFPDGWTDIPGASDSARYKALGNSVAIPCVEYVIRGIALVLRAG